MFGYIAPNPGALNEEQKNRYRCFYCGLCRELGRISGSTGRLMLSHDMTFLAILLNSLMEPGEKEEHLRCLLHPLNSRKILSNRAVSYAACMNLILMDFKCQDQIRDEHSRSAGLRHEKLKDSVLLARKEYPVQFDGIETALRELWEEEESEHPDPDRLCQLSGKMLGASFVPEWADPYWKNGLRRLGEGLGQFVYWMDAWEDLEEDIRKGQPNPLRKWEKEEDLEDFVKTTLEMMMGETTDCFELLPLEKDLDLLRNVLYSGVWQRYEMMMRRSKRRKKA